VNEQTCSKAFSQPVIEFPEFWTGLVRQRKLNELLALYYETSILLPTFSPHRISKPEGLRSYFNQLSEREELNVRLHDNTVVCQQISPDDYVLLGIYSWQFMVDDTLLTFPSRFTFVLDLSKVAPIMHHHSSQIPRTLN
jgi:hypothetical protein